MTIKQAAIKWGISWGRAYQLFNEGRINGVRVIDGHIFVPDDAPKPKEKIVGKRTLRRGSK